jgi:hypothetical protein
MGVAVLRSLTVEQQYTEEEIEFTLDWIIRNLPTRFNGRVQSLGIVPHVIGEALQEKANNERKHERDCLRLREEREEQERDAQLRARTKELNRLPSEERARLRTQAIKSLTDQGLQRQFLMENLIKLEMLRLLERRDEL